MDQAVGIPGTSIRLGADALVGLIPGIGDLVGGAVSSWFIVTGARLGAPPALLARMALNVGIDALLGVVPLLGDLFDIGWKANLRNLALLEAHLADPHGTRRRSRRALAGVALGVIVAIGILLGASVWVGVQLVQWIWSAIQGG